MSERELLAIMAAIIHAGADSPTQTAGYHPESATAKARDILACVDKAAVTVDAVYDPPEGRE